MENQELDIYIMPYIDGEMTAKEIELFEIRMSNDEVLLQAVTEYKLIASGVKEYGEKHQSHFKCNQIYF